MSRVAEAIIRLELDIEQAKERLAALRTIEAQLAEYEAKQQEHNVTTGK